MPGIKGKTGGQRAGAGRPATDNPVTTLALSREARQELRILTMERQAIANNKAITQRQVLEGLIHAAWLEYDAAIQRIVEELSDVEP